MPTVHPIVFYLGRSELTVAGTNHHTYYEKIGDLLFPGRCRPTQEHAKYIPVSTETMDEDAAHVYDLFHKQCNDIQLKDSCILVDIHAARQTIMRPRVEMHIINAIQSILEGTGADTSIALLLQEMPPPKYYLTQRLKPCMRSGRFYVISDTGEIAPKRRGFKTVVYRQIRTEMRNPFRGFRHRLIRRHGHFRRKDGNVDVCASYYYDGRYCVPELCGIIQEFLESANFQKDDIIVCHAPESPWLEEATVATAERNSLKNLAFHSRADWKRACHEFDKARRIFLFVDLVDTGETLRQIVNEFAPKSIREKLTVSSAIVTATCDGRDDKIVEKDIPHVGKISGFCQVVQHKCPRDECIACIAGIPRSTRDGHEEDELSFAIRSHQFWNMALEHQMLSSEHNAQAYRSSEQKIPDLEAILKRDGAWITNKIDLAIRRVLGQSSKFGTYIIVCPSNERVSKQLIETMRGFLPADVVPIPRDIFGKCKTDEDAQRVVRQNGKTQPEWMKSLNTKQGKSVVLLDDMSVSGNTLYWLERLVTALGREVACAFTLLSVAQGEKARLTTKHLAMYEIG